MTTYFFQHGYTDSDVARCAKSTSASVPVERAFLDDRMHGQNELIAQFEADTWLDARHAVWLEHSL